MYYPYWCVPLFPFFTYFICINKCFSYIDKLIHTFKFSPIIYIKCYSSPFCIQFIFFIQLLYNLSPFCICHYIYVICIAKYCLHKILCVFIEWYTDINGFTYSYYCFQNYVEQQGWHALHLLLYQYQQIFLEPLQLWFWLSSFNTYFCYFY